MGDDREFDRMLEEELTALPLPDDTVAEVNPWRRAMVRIVWGTGLTTLTLNFWYLNYLLPAVGVVLLFLGFRTLRRENRWFALCWGLSLLDLASFYVGRVMDATIWVRDLPPLGAALALLGLVRSFCLWRGIRAVRRCAGQEDRAGAAAALLTFQCALVALGLLGGGNLQLQGLVFVVIFLGLYICIMRSLAKLPALLDGAGYVVRAAGARLSELAVWITWAVLLAAGLLVAGTVFCRYPMEWSPVEAGEQRELEEIRDSLLALGMPEQVAEDLAPGDLALLEGALSVTVQVREEPFNDGREERSVSGRTIHVQTVYDVRELCLSDIAVELPGGRWRIIHHFLWQAEPGLRTTECISLWPTTRDGFDGWRQEGEVTGRLLFDWQGTTYEGDYYSISTEPYTTNSFFWGESQSTDPTALFSLPRRGEYCRGYLTYGVETVEEGWLLDSWVNYTHQVKWLNYPAMTAQEYDRSGIWNGFGAFHTAQNAIQFYPASEAEKGSYQTR